MLSVTEPEGEDVVILGVAFDCQLAMQSTCDSLASECSWKLKSLLRTIRFNTTADMVRLYKAQLLSFIEYRASAIYHATVATLVQVDRVQERFLKGIRITEADALMHFCLAPLCTRRAVSMLGGAAQS